MRPSELSYISQFLRVCLLAALVFTLASCQSVPTAREAAVRSLIPAPALIESTPGFFTLHEGALLSVRSLDAQAIGTARIFADLLARTRGLHLDLRPDKADAADGIEFTLDPRLLIPGDTGDEGYELNVSAQRITLAARTPHGLFNGSVTLWQLLTQDGVRDAALNVACVHIRDYPRFAWRGVMLDSARHYQGADAVKHLIDEMALHKMDVLHWHLTDDQGWRIEIKKYPELTRVGAWRVAASAIGKPVRYGGFYTQEQIRDIVAYAAERFITIVPEIEMPGHAQAAIAAYPELGVTGARPAVSPDWGVHTYLFNADEATFDFLENVLTEVMQLFPGAYIHVGGDEAAKDQWQASPRVQQRMRELGVADEAALQSYFISRMERFLGAHGRNLIGWDEILQGGLPPRATVMSWQGEAGGVEAARQGHDVVMAPSPLLYFDHVQSRRHDEPPGRPDVVSLADVYAYEPLPPELDAAQAPHVLGAQANLWTEYMATPRRVEYAAFPRVAALAEVLWSPRARRDWQDFLKRLPAQLDRYRTLGVDFADTAFAADVSAQMNSDTGKVKVELSNQTHFGEIRYTIDASDPVATSPAYDSPLQLPSSGTLAAGVFLQGHALAATRKQSLDALSLMRLNSDQLQPCKPGQGLPLRLPGPALGGGQAVFLVDIFDPCWIYPHANLGAAARVVIAVAELPYNYQLWKDDDKVVLRKPVHPGGELQIHQDRCDGDVLATIGLAGIVLENGAARLEATLPHPAGTHDLCFMINRATRNPLWAIDTVQLAP
jgi:hexosaminidase